MGYDDYNEKGLERLVGRQIAKVKMNPEYIVFIDTTGQEFWYCCWGDCCSRSYFYDAYGINHLIHNGPVLGVETVEMAEPQDANAQAGEFVQAYGFRPITEHKMWRDVSTTFSFRNDSNGYYGGVMEPCSAPPLGSFSLEGLVDISDKDWYVAQ